MFLPEVAILWRRNQWHKFVWKKSCPFIILSSSATQPVRLFLLAAAQLSACHWPPNPCWPPLVPTSNNPTLPRSVFWCSLFMQVLVGVLLKPLKSLRLFPTQPTHSIFSIFSKQPNFALITVPPFHRINRAGTSFQPRTGPAMLALG